MTNNRSFFEEFIPNQMTVRLAQKGITAKVLGTRSGNVNILDDKDTPVKITSKNVLYMPSLDKNLLSVSKITQNKLKVEFGENDFNILRNRKILAVRVRYGRL